MKRTICVVLVILLFLTTVMPAQAAPSQPSAWAVERVAQARDRGLVPDALLSNYQAPITRQEFAMLVAKAYTGLSGKLSCLQVPILSPIRSTGTSSLPIR